MPRFTGRRWTCTAPSQPYNLPLAQWVFLASVMSCSLLCMGSLSGGSAGGSMKGAEGSQCWTYVRAKKQVLAVNTEKGYFLSLKAQENPNLLCHLGEDEGCMVRRGQTSVCGRAGKKDKIPYCRASLIYTLLFVDCLTTLIAQTSSFHSPCSREFAAWMWAAV